jgi:uncharacterized protein YndB with AHSA1/START domain
MNVMEKEKIELEYILNTSPSILFKQIGTPEGLSEWFADDVNCKDDVYTFEWDGSTEIAKLQKCKKGDCIRFQWEYDEDTECYFEMLITIEPLTNQVALVVTDFAESDEVEDVKLLWDNSISRLRSLIGG